MRLCKLTECCGYLAAESSACSCCLPEDPMVLVEGYFSLSSLKAAGNEVSINCLSSQVWVQIAFFYMSGNFGSYLKHYD